MTARPHSVGNLQSAVGAFAITPNDGVDLAQTARAIFVQGSATLVDLKVTMLDGTTVTLLGLASGVMHPIQVRRVWATGTTATNIIGLV